MLFLDYRHHFSAAPLVSVLSMPFGIESTQGGDLTKTSKLQKQLSALASAHPGRVGICAQASASRVVCVNGDRRFSLQSVMKVVVGVAAMRAVDEGRLTLSDPILIRREDLSVNIQPIADIVDKDGSFQTNIGDLIRRAVVESDSAATDVLIAKLGGVNAIRNFLLGAGFDEIGIDRTERELQTETVGLKWQPSFVFPKALNAARDGVPDKQRAAAFEAYLTDKRDTATPRGMSAFLYALASGQLLSPTSTMRFLEVMANTVTFPDRLRAGTPDGWTVMHKTGTSQSYKGVNGVTNDVGILRAPDGGFVAIAAFVAESRASSADRAAVIANAARAVTSGHR